MTTTTTMPARSEIEAARASGRADFVRECSAYCAAQGKPHLGIWLMEYEIRARANACLGPAPAPILPAPTSSEVFLARTLFAWDAWRVSTDATTAAAGTLDEALCHVEIDGQPRMLRLRTSVGQYPGNGHMCEILHKVVDRLNA